MKIIKLKGDGFRITREHDGFGGQGTILKAVSKRKTKYLKLIGYNGEIRIGYRLFCGRFLDFVVTTDVQEILEINKDQTRVRLKTLNSVYLVESRFGDTDERE